MNESVFHAEWRYPHPLSRTNYPRGPAGVWPSYDTPAPVITALMGSKPSVLASAFGAATAGRIQSGRMTVTDLIVGAVWLGINPVGMWEQVPRGSDSQRP